MDGRRDLRQQPYIINTKNNLRCRDLTRSKALWRRRHAVMRAAVRSVFTGVIHGAGSF